MRQKLAEELSEFGHKGQVIHEQREVPDREAARTHGLRRQDQDQAGADADSVSEDRLDQLGQQLILQHGFAASVVEPAEMIDH